MDATAALVLEGGADTTALWRGTTALSAPLLQAARGAAAGTRDPQGAHPHTPAARAAASAARRDPRQRHLLLVLRRAWFPAAPLVCASLHALPRCCSGRRGAACLKAAQVHHHLCYSPKALAVGGAHLERNSAAPSFSGIAFASLPSFPI
jgi:hypothetical protein